VSKVKKKEIERRAFFVRVLPTRRPVLTSFSAAAS
jgi:hypothetical protein